MLYQGVKVEEKNQYSEPHKSLFHCLILHNKEQEAVKVNQILTIHKNGKREESEDHHWLEVEHCVYRIGQTCRQGRADENQS